MTTKDCNQQAETFLASNGIKFRATLSDSKAPAWDGPHGHHYRVTLSKTGHSWDYFTDRGTPGRLTFDFWASKADADKGLREVSAYDVLACISSDAHCPETFEDYCAEYGGDSDSIRDLQTFRRCSRFAKRLRDFFTPKEIEQLSEIQ